MKLCQFLKERMNFFQSVSYVGGRSYNMVSLLRQKKTNSPVTIMMVSRSRLTGLEFEKERKMET